MSRPKGRKNGKYTLFKIVCQTCGKKFKTIFSRIKRRRYCSKKCYWKDLKKSIPWNKGLEGIHLNPTFEFKKGHIAWNKGLTKKNDERINYLRPTKFRKGQISFNKGKKLSEETKHKISNALSMSKSILWKGGRIITSNRYVRIYKPKHPFARNKYVFEHRLVMEKILGRYLKPKEVVHHKNKNTLDNRIKNLKLFKNTGEHKKYHLILKKSF